ncbi:NAD(P)-binding domain-containing protein [Nitrospira defluvii]|uniref:Meso-diaminopimelate D-dehydrogenase n=1 Tax=Nitrospira defluvii TaxID=330214 RepID=A0ABN7LT12_9BACT|nr:NAD(P)-binding domain-containing protein [Nitrospira defluvii]CAE6759206.1 Meso-diaminopimelate D-dehydrogenase [Nitrospira defluvii]
MNATGQKGNNTIRLAVVGFGKVGKACAESLIESKDLVLAAIVRRLDSLAQVLPDAFSKIPIVSHTAQVQQVEGALLCVPMAQVLDTAHECLQHGIPIIESSVLHGEAFQAHRDAMHRLAMRYEVPAIVGAGWDPGALSFLRSLFALLVPEGNIEIRHRVAASLRHTAMARQVVGVKEALCTEQLAADGTRQRYVYVELAKGVDPDRVAAAIRADPLFFGEETLVFPVESIAALEQEGRGIVLERRSAPGSSGHQRFLFEARFDESLLTARMMLAAARALPGLKPGAHSLFDLPISALWGEQAHNAERSWL